MDRYTVYSSEKENREIQELEAEFKKLVKEYCVCEWQVPSLIKADILKKCGYFTSMPHQLTKVSPFLNSDESDGYYLTPAACLHIYPELSKQKVNNKIITTLEKVYRYESGLFYDRVRNWEFLVREFVAIGDEKFVKDFLEKMKCGALDILKKYSIAGEVVVGNDHFYPSRYNKMAEKFQILNKLKYELIVDNNELGKIALSSFNFHGSHFSKTFEFDENETVVTGCVGFGIDRWIYALNYGNSVE